MKVYLNKITGIDDAIISMYMSNPGSWSVELQDKIKAACFRLLDKTGKITPIEKLNYKDRESDYDIIMGGLSKVCKWGKKHITMLRFIDFSFTVEGLHRGGQDDWDAHAKRFDNRIIRNSTRVTRSNFTSEVSDFYKGKIIPTDTALKILGIEIPDSFEYEGNIYIKGVNGYILEKYKDNPDVKRGLYMLSIPSNFIFKINCCEFAHVYKERNETSAANPEVKECCESCLTELNAAYPQFNRELFLDIKN